MAGAGSRFAKEGYKDHKPVILVTDRRSGKKIPMVVAATLDLPQVSGANIIYVDRDFHKKDGVEEKIKEFFPATKFITIAELTEGQASTCLLAKEQINNDQELLIAGCDNGIAFDEKKFLEAKKSADVLIFTFRGNEAVLENPKAYGWVNADSAGNVSGVSVKVPVSENPIKDHAIVSAFWFKKGADFVSNAEEMIAQNDRINNEFYADQVMKYCVKNGLKVKVFEVDKYLCWGTPLEYENYEKTIKYWRGFYEAEFGKKLSISVPCYNEEKNIPLIISAFKKAVGERKNIEVLLVNNGSTDNSANVFAAELAKEQGGIFKLVKVVKNQGYGFGILSGLEAATGNVLAWSHADMQTDPADVIQGFDLFSGDEIFIKGKRKNRALLEALFTFGMQIIASLALKTYLDDINAQPKIFSRNFYEKFVKNKAPHDFSLDLFVLYMAKKHDLKIKEIAVDFAKRLHGEAKGGGSWKTRIKLIKRTFTYIFELKRNIEKT